MRFSLATPRPRLLLLLLAASCAHVRALPLRLADATAAAAAFISDNDIDMASGIYNVVFELRQRDPDELVDPDSEEFASVQRLHDGRRGWGYSETREGFHPML